MIEGGRSLDTGMAIIKADNEKSKILMTAVSVFLGQSLILTE
jgi:hypothetical protein